MDRSVGVLLADSAAVEVGLGLAGPDAEWFVMDEGVRALPLLRSRIDAGTEVTVCATDAAGMEPIPGVRMGSQYDHALMVRNVARLIALTGVRVDDHRPRRDERTVIVRVTRLEKVAQALRTAVGYAAGDLRVAVLLEPPVHGIIERPLQGVARSLATLRGLDHPIVAVAAGEYPARLRWDVEVAW
jgi:hypothetical protein